MKRGRKVIGMVAVANKPGGYTPEDKHTLTRLSSVISVSRQHRIALTEARKTSQELEQLVAQRTKALQESEERYRTFVEQSAEGIYRCETEQPIPVDLPVDEQVSRFYQHIHVAESNDVQARMYGYSSAEELIGKTMAELHGGPDNPENIAFLRDVIENDYRLTDALSEEVDKDGNPKYFLNNVIGIVEEGLLVRFWGTQRDITDLRQAEEKLREYSERLETMVQERTEELRAAQEELIRKERLATLGQLTGGVAHELRNPLGAIKNAVYFLNMALENPEAEVKETLEILVREVKASERTVSSLLGYARPKPPKRRKVSINKLLQSVLSRAAVPENVELVDQTDDRLPSVQGDPDQLASVFANIILNAIQAMPKGGRLVIESEVRGERLALSFTDTGVGIPEEDATRVFEPLFTSKARGIGLGLAVSKSLAEGHGGTIEVQSQDGKGSTFTVWLPVGPAREA